jgi:predicted ester cyclase
MEAMPVTYNPTLEAPHAKLMREPLFWASAAAFVGVVVGLAATFSLAAWYADSSGVSTGPPALALWGGPLGHFLAALSLLGVPVLALEQGRGSRVLQVATTLIGAWLTLELVVPFSPLLFPSQWSFNDELSYFIAASVATTVLGSAALLSLGLGAFFSGARRLGALLLLLGVPGDLLFFSVHNALTGTIEISQQLLVTSTSLFGTDLGVPEACLFAILGAMLLFGARGQAFARAERVKGEENRGKALRLYEVGLAKNDPSVVEKVVSKDFRDPRRGLRGKGGMGRIVSDLWASYPDLEVSVVSQEAEGDVVRIRLVLSGTDRGSGVMWYPPTGRWVSFEVEFTDRFRRGELVEHTGWVDTEGLLRQLGHHQRS